MVNIIEQAARIMDPELFDTTYQVHSALYRAKLEYKRSKVLNQAAMILQFAAKEEHLRDRLFEAEREDWERLGVPKDVLNMPEIRQIIKDKFR